MSLSKTTVYYWYERFVGKKVKPVHINESDTEAVGEFIGIFAGDGNYFFEKGYKYRITIYLYSKDKPYVRYVSKLVTGVVGKKPWIYTVESEHVTIVRLYSKEVYKLLKRYLSWDGGKTATVTLAASAPHDKQFSIGFLRGLIDTDGTIGHNRAIFSTISHGLSRDIEGKLKMLKISFKTYLQIDKRENIKPIYRINVTKDFARFVVLINPQHFNYLRSK